MIGKADTKQGCQRTVFIYPQGVMAISLGTTNVSLKRMQHLLFAGLPHSTKAPYCLRLYFKFIPWYMNHSTTKS
ncbi:hypothetical protein EV207_1421 [Scopulibacillus darangshiensis]|uniref:Uncharacterized protein n=1 Tax=Scopulibacillus darangshiensis TaxID=442528 RepID=A0A4R2NJ87_9BACL|nr:hypothetical protein EV207_1421 [Scopulibacillus darangshiensis]